MIESCRLCPRHCGAVRKENIAGGIKFESVMSQIGQVEKNIFDQTFNEDAEEYCEEDEP